MALSTNLSVLIVSSIFLEEGERLPKMKVYVFPVRDYCSNLVSLDYLKAATAFLSPLERAKMTFPKVVRDRLIFLSYLSCTSVMAYFLLIFYDPAKSHRFNRPFKKEPFLSSIYNSNWKIV